MDKTTKIILGLIVAVIVIAGIWYGASRKPAEKEVIKIGVILPLTGYYAVFGEEIKRGVEMSFDEFGKNLNVELIFEDDKGEFGPGSVNAANKLVSIDKVNAVMTSVVEEARPTIPIFNNAKIPLLVMWDSNRFIDEGGDYIFGNGFSTEKAGEKMAEFAYENLKIRKIAIISHIDPWADIISSSFKEKFLSLGGFVVYDEKFNVDSNDYRTAVIKIKKSNPEGVYFPMIPPSLARFIIQTSQLKIGVPLMTGDGLLQDVITETKEASEDIYYTNIFTDNADYLTKKYKERYQADPIDAAMVSSGYDGFKKVAEAIRISSGDIKNGLLQVFGNKRTTNRTEKIFVVKNSQPVEVDN